MEYNISESVSLNGIKLTIDQEFLVITYSISPNGIC